VCMAHTRANISQMSNYLPSLASTAPSPSRAPSPT
jgi:hypothetical protein